MTVALLFDVLNVVPKTGFPINEQQGTLFAVNVSHNST